MMNRLKNILTYILIAAVISGNLWAGNDRFKVKEVIFDGNNIFPGDRLEKLMLTRTSRFLASSYYYPEVLADDLDNLIIFYQQNGYLDAKIVEYKALEDSTTMTCTVNINIDEGELTRVGGLDIFGNNAFADSTLRNLIKLTRDEPFRRNLIQEGQMAILSFYAEHGYLDAVVKPDIKINSETHLGYIDFIITENDRFSVGDIIIDGNTKTNRKVIVRELSFKPDETIQYSKLLTSQRNLYATGLFESVFISPQPAVDSIPGQRAILIDIKEKKSSEFGILVGYGSEDKARTRTELNTNNWSGTARKGGVGFKASFIRREIDASFTDPRLFGTRWQFDVNSMFEFYEQPGYDVSRLVNLISIGRPLGKTTYLKTSFRYEDAQLRHVEVIDTLETFKPRVRSFKLTLSHDSRDNLFDPRKGLFIEWSSEIAGAFLSGNNTFTRSVITFKIFRELNNRTVLASALEIGLVDRFGSYAEIPLSERFYAGGTNSIRGFDYQMVGPLDAEDNPLGGKFKVVWNAMEVRRSVYKIVGAVYFIDVGNVWEEARHFKLTDLRISTGLGLRANSPIGILRLDYGINLDRRNSEPRAVLHFNMGQTF